VSVTIHLHGGPADGKTFKTNYVPPYWEVAIPESVPNYADYYAMNENTPLTQSHFTRVRYDIGEVIEMNFYEPPQTYVHCYWSELSREETTSNPEHRSRGLEYWHSIYGVARPKPPTPPHETKRRILMEPLP
jgi:hypothetical protein